jgi:manganese efflux pump family protein
MSMLSIAILALSMSVDAFVASLGKGAMSQQPNIRHALKTGAVFGAVEGLAPLIGWSAGLAASRYIAAVDHWIAFSLLGAVGLRMVFQAWQEQVETHHTPSHWALLIAAIGTSVDALVVGVSLAFIDVNIAIVALAIGLTTWIMSTTGMIAGRFIGLRFGRFAEAFGGCALIGLGTLILVQHLTAS